MYRCIIELNTAQFPPISRTSLPIFFYKILIFMAMRDRERGTVFWSSGYPENIDQTHQLRLRSKFRPTCDLVDGLSQVLINTIQQKTYLLRTKTDTKP